MRVVLKRTVVGDSDCMNFRQPERKSSSESSKSVVCQSNVISLVRKKQIGQFSRDVIGCKTQVALVSCDWSVSIRG